MGINKKLLNNFNHSNSILVVSSYPARRGELACDNAVARYSKLLFDSFPKEQKIVILCEKRFFNDLPYLAKKNILVVPTYCYNSFNFLPSILRNLILFNRVKYVHFQFEFSSFGGKKVIPQFMSLVFFSKLLQRNNSVMLHQVNLDLNKLSLHLGLKKNSFFIKMYNLYLKFFYNFVGFFSEKIIVHDHFLAEKLELVINPKKIHIIPHGVSEFSPVTISERKAARRKYGIKNEDFVVGLFGYKSAYKGTDWAVKAVGNIAEKNKRVKLMVIGGESPTLRETAAYAKFLNKYEKLVEKYPKVIIETGFVPENEVKKTLAAVDLIIFPYRHKMSASGAFSVILGHGIPFMGSSAFEGNFSFPFVNCAIKSVGLDYKNLLFSLKRISFKEKFNNFIKFRQYKNTFKLIGKKATSNMQWDSVAFMYQEVIVQEELALQCPTEYASA